MKKSSKQTRKALELKLTAIRLLETHQLGNIAGGQGGDAQCTITRTCTFMTETETTF